MIHQSTDQKHIQKEAKANKYTRFYFLNSMQQEKVCGKWFLLGNENETFVELGDLVWTVGSRLLPGCNEFVKGCHVSSYITYNILMFDVQCFVFYVLFNSSYQEHGLPWWLSSKRICPQCRRCGIDPWVRKIPWRREWQPIPVFFPGESHGQRSSVAFSSQSELYH